MTHDRRRHAVPARRQHRGRLGVVQPILDPGSARRGAARLLSGRHRGAAEAEQLFARGGRKWRPSDGAENAQHEAGHRRAPRSCPPISGGWPRRCVRWTRPAPIGFMSTSWMAASCRISASGRWWLPRSGGHAKPLDVHLMMVEPERYLVPFAGAGADHLLVHSEDCARVSRRVFSRFGYRRERGAVLDPATPLGSVADVWICAASFW